ncbi:hypothetical protein ABZS29_17580 [Kribbella sp. NPDC005582]|uniref:hypothetical protein n=1 Tax=Kribbella sp. NPDC005582 TaxID=3156893 RepID=UPI0033A301C4
MPSPHVPLADLTIENELSAATGDRRTSAQVYVSESPGVECRLVSVEISEVATYSTEFRAAYGLPDSGPVHLVGGGMAHGRAAVTPTGGREQPVQALLRQALDRAYDQGAYAMTPYAQLELATAAAPFLISSQPAVDAWYTLPLQGATDLESFLASLPRKARGTWRHDLRTREELGVVSRCVPVAGHEDEYGRLLSSVEQRNGQPTSARVAAFRLKSLTVRQGEFFAIESRIADELVAVAVLCSSGRYLDGLSIGLASGMAGHRDLYHVAGYLATLEYGLDHGVELIGFGRSHHQPKKNRGCEAEPLSRLVYSTSPSELTASKGPM